MLESYSDPKRREDVSAQSDWRVIEKYAARYAFDLLAGYSPMTSHARGSPRAVDRGVMLVQ